MDNLLLENITFILSSEQRDELDSLLAIIATQLHLLPVDVGDQLLGEIATGVSKTNSFNELNLLMLIINTRVAQALLQAEFDRLNALANANLKVSDLQLSPRIANPLRVHAGIVYTNFFTYHSPEWLISTAIVRGIADQGLISLQNALAQAGVVTYQGEHHPDSIFAALMGTFLKYEVREAIKYLTSRGIYLWQDIARMKESVLKQELKPLFDGDDRYDPEVAINYLVGKLSTKGLTFLAEEEV